VPLLKPRNIAAFLKKHSCILTFLNAVWRLYEFYLDQASNQLNKAKLARS